MWQTLSKAEWDYLIHTRATSSGIRYAKAKVDGVSGLILLPDNWNSSYFILNRTNQENAVFNSNILTLSQWNDIEMLGGVFLPAAGDRYGTSVEEVGDVGFYYTSTYEDNNDVFSLGFYDDELDVDEGEYRCFGHSVRLVCIAGNNTSVAVPSVTTTPISDIMANTAKGGGTVTSDGGATVTERGICWSTSHNPTINGEHQNAIGGGVGNFTCHIFGLTEGTTYYVRAYATNSVGTGYGEEVSFFTTEGGGGGGLSPIGAINGRFSVSASQRVYFSQGNLQYQASTNTWRFATNQYDYIGSANSNISSSYSGWIDLFGWGTSGYNHGAVCYQPWSTSTNCNDYYAYGQWTYNLYDQTGQADWGYNAISNGGNATHQWRTLMHEEWNYVFNTRSTSSGIRYAKAQVAGVNGIILLPDDWSTSYYSLSSTNSIGASFTSNVISSSNWTSSLQSHGAVFLPAAGGRYGTSVYVVGSYGYYWSASYCDSDIAWVVSFGDGRLYAGDAYTRAYGFSVRLVCPAE